MMLMDGNRSEDLQRMYLLFLKVNALESLRQALSSYIRRTGQGIVMDEEKDKDMVSCLLEFKASLDTIWEDSFSKNEAFCNTIKDAFEHLINLRQVSIIFAVEIFLSVSLLLLTQLNKPSSQLTGVSYMDLFLPVDFICSCILMKSLNKRIKNLAMKMYNGVSIIFCAFFWK